jgi:hypothetical protein
VAVVVGAEKERSITRDGDPVRPMHWPWSRPRRISSWSILSPETLRSSPSRPRGSRRNYSTFAVSVRAVCTVIEAEHTNS